MIAYTSGPRAGSLGDFFRQRLCAEFPLTLSNLLIGLSRTLLRSSLNVSFFCPSTPSSHLSLFVSLPHVSYIRTIYFICILCRFPGFHLVCRLSSVPLGYTEG